VLVAAGRYGPSIGELWEESDDVAIAAITAAELLAGVELADKRRRERRLRAVEDILATLPVEDYDLDVARSHAGLLAHTRRSGHPRGAHVLIIAATALARDRVVVTADPAGFEQLPGVIFRSP
jgi:tRNA(fMet)-specific endonuclease VapC